MTQIRIVKNSVPAHAPQQAELQTPAVALSTVIDHFEAADQNNLATQQRGARASLNCEPDLQTVFSLFLEERRNKPKSFVLRQARQGPSIETKSNWWQGLENREHLARRAKGVVENKPLNTQLYNLLSLIGGNDQIHQKLVIQLP